MINQSEYANLLLSIKEFNSIIKDYTDKLDSIIKPINAMQYSIIDIHKPIKNVQKEVSDSVIKFNKTISFYVDQYDKIESIIKTYKDNEANKTLEEAEKIKYSFINNIIKFNYAIMYYMEEFNKIFQINKKCVDEYDTIIKSLKSMHKDKIAKYINKLDKVLENIEDIKL